MTVHTLLMDQRVSIQRQSLREIWIFPLMLTVSLSFDCFQYYYRMLILPENKNNSFRYNFESHLADNSSCYAIFSRLIYHKVKKRIFDLKIVIGYLVCPRNLLLLNVALQENFRSPWKDIPLKSPTVQPLDVQRPIEVQRRLVILYPSLQTILVAILIYQSIEIIF